MARGISGMHNPTNSGSAAARDVVMGQCDALRAADTLLDLSCELPGICVQDSKFDMVECLRASRSRSRAGHALHTSYTDISRDNIVLARLPKLLTGMCLTGKMFSECPLKENQPSIRGHGLS